MAEEYTPTPDEAFEATLYTWLDRKRQFPSEEAARAGWDRMLAEVRRLAIEEARGSGSPTDDQVERAAQAMCAHDNPWVDPGYAWSVQDEHGWADYRAEARAALVAAGVSAAKPVEPDNLSIMNGWLVECVNEHTCGGGTIESGYHHEPGCGYEPLVNLAEIPGYPADAASAMDRVNRLHQTVLRGNSMLGEELDAWCVHCNIPYPCHTMQALAPALPSSGVDEDAREFRFTDAQWREYQSIPEQGYSHRHHLEHVFNEWLKGQGGESSGR